MAAMWIDHHCHLPDAPEHLEWLDGARAAGVSEVIDVGTRRRQLAAARSSSRRTTEGVWATAGVHPHDAAGGIDGVEALLGAPEVVAVGECGLDYHYLHSPVEDQREVFAAQVELAHRHDLAARDPHPGGVGRHVRHPRRGRDPARTAVFHCFTGGPDEARRCLDAGASLSFSGIVTFGSADDVREAALLCPLDRMLVETDSPVPGAGAPSRTAQPARARVGRRPVRRRAARRRRPRTSRGRPPPTPGAATACPTPRALP